MRHLSQSPTTHRSSRSLIALAFTLLFFSTCVGEAFALTISGRVYVDEGVTQLSTAGKTIVVRVGTTTAGFFATSTVAANGFWQIQNITATGFFLGMPIHVWVDNDATFRAATFTKASSTSNNISNLDLYKHTVIVKHEAFTGTSTTNADLAVYDGDDNSSLLFTSNANELRVTATTTYVASGTTFAPGGNASTSALTIGANATVTAPQMFTLAGNYTNNGIFTAGSGTTYFRGGYMEATGTLSGASAFNNVIIEGLAGTNSWTRVSSTTAGAIGTTTSAITGVYAVIEFSGTLYAGTNKTNAAEVYRYDGNNLWTPVTFAPGQITSGGTTNIDQVRSMVVFNGSLYVGTSETNAAEVYRYDGGTTWTKVTQAAGTIALSGTANIDFAHTFAVVNDTLYLGTYESLLAEVYRYDGGTTWTKVTQAAGTIASGGNTGISGAYSMAVVNNTLYLGTHESNAGEVYRYDGGTTWTRVHSTAGTLSGTANIDMISRLVNVNGTLYAGTYDVTVGLAEVYRYDGGTTWTKVTQAAGTIAVSGTTAIDGIFMMQSVGGTLYVGTTKANAAEVYRYDGGTTWTKVTQAAGTIASGGTASIDYILWGTVFRGSLYVGTYDSTNIAEIYRFNNGNVVFQSTSASTTDLTINSGATLAIPQIFSVAGNYTNNGAVTGFFGSASALSTTYFSGASSQSLSGIMTGDAGQLNHVVFTGAGTKTFGANASTSNFVVQSGSGAVTAPSTSLTVSGNYTNNGTFTNNGGTVFLSGASPQTLAGNMTGSTNAFNNLTILNNSGTDPDSNPGIIFANSASTTGTFTAVVASTTIRFQAGATSSVAYLVLMGSSANPNAPVYLRSSSSGLPWFLHVTGGQDIWYVNTKDSYACTGISINVVNGTNSGGNSCWNFLAPFRISGRVYTDEGVTQLTTAGKTIRVRIGTSTPAFFATSTVAANGFWQISNILNPGVAAGIPVTVWVDNDTTFRAATLTKASTSDINITGLNLFKNTLIVKHEAFNGTSTTNADLGAYDGDDDGDIQFRVTGSDLTVNATTTLYVAPGSEFKPGGTITLHGNRSNANGDGDLRLATGLRQDGAASTSILTMESNALDLAGNWYASSTSIFRHAGIVTFNSSSTGNKLIFATSSPFYNLSFNGVGPKKFAADATTTGFTIGAGTTVIGPPNLSVDNLTIASGGTLTHEQNSTTQAYTLNLSLTTLTINAGGKIDVSMKGYSGSTGTGAGTGGLAPGGGGHGGNGGHTKGGPTYGSTTAPTTIGSGGGSNSVSGGTGGGAVKLVVSGTLTVDGEILAHGQDVSWSNWFQGWTGGGGSGGSIWIDASTFTGSGTIAANGGDSYGDSGYANGAAGSGGGGRVALYYTTNTYTGTTTAYGGNIGSQKGGAGTVYTKSSAASVGDLLVDNSHFVGGNTTSVANETFLNMAVKNAANYIVASPYTFTFSSTSLAISTSSSITIQSGATLNAPNTTPFSTSTITNNGVYNHSGSTLTISNGVTWNENGTLSAIGNTQPITDIVVNGTLEFQNQSTTTATSFSTLTVNSGGIVRHPANTTTQVDGLNLSLSTLAVNAGGKIDVSGKGFTNSSGTGEGADGANPGGGGHGGNGGHTKGGITYGSTTAPTTIGSGGGANSVSGSSGGGTVRLVVSGTLTLNGEILADGQDASWSNWFQGWTGGGGSGGSIWIDAGTLTGAGTTSANGGDSYGDSGYASGAAGSGGGGRVALYYTTNTYTGTTTAYAGNLGNQKGGAGTVFMKAASQAYGNLLIDNNNVVGTTTMMIATTTVDNLTIIKAGQFVVPSGYTLSVASTTITSTANAGISVYTGGTFSAANVTSLNNFTLTNSGTTTLTALVTLAGTNTITNNGILNYSGTSLSIPSGTTWYENGTLPTIGNTQPITDIVLGGTLEFRNQSNASSASFNTLTINSGGTLTHGANASSQTDSLNLSLTTLTVNTGGKIDVSTRGYTGGSGTGAGTGGTGAGGAGHGGSGGNTKGGGAYGSTTAPTTIGSSGGIESGTAGVGGGLVQLIVSGTATIDGQILANGSDGSGDTFNGYYNGGGAGGGIWIDAGTLAGNGTISANGGSAFNNNEAGGGGGGRIALYYTTLSYSGATTTYGGSTGLQKGGAGTIFTKAASQSNGDLRINNNSVVGTTTRMLATTTVRNLTIQNSANFIAPQSLTVTGNFILSNATFSHNGATTTFSGASPQTITGTTTGTSAFNHLEFSGAGIKTFINYASSTNFSINPGSGMVTAPTLLSVAGDLTANGAFSAGSGTIYFSGSSAQAINAAMVGANPFDNITFLGAGTKSFGSNNASTSNFTIQAGSGTVTAPPMLTIAGNFVNNGTFASNSGTVYLSSTTPQMLSGNMTGTSAFSALRFAGGGDTATSSGLIAYWRFDDGGGTSAADGSGQGNTGTLSGTSLPTWTTGKVNGALNFDGVNNEVTTTNNYGNSSSVQTISISIWFKTGSASGKKIIGLEQNQTGTGSSNYDRHIYVSTTGVVRFYVWDGGAKYAVSTASSYADNQWHHVVGTVTSGSNMKLYVDGVLQQTTTIGTPATNYTSSYWRIGGYANAVGVNGSSGYFPGLIDELRIYNREVSSSEVTQLYLFGSKRFLNNASSTDFIIDSGAVTAPSLLTVGGNYANNGTFFGGDGTVYFDSANPQSISGILTGTSTFASTTFLGSGTKTFSDNASTTNFSITQSGTTVVAPALLTVRGNYTNNATFNANGGVVYLCNSLPQTLSGNMTSSSAFFNVRVSDNTTCGTISGLISHWKFDDGSGTSVTDASGRGNTGTLSGNPLPAWTSGRWGSALSFASSSSNEITTTTNYGNSSALTTITMSAWFKTASLTGGRKIVGLEQNQTGTGSTVWDRVLYVDVSGKVSFYVWDGAGKYASTSATTYADNQWHHAVGTVTNGSNMKLYVDGVLQQTTTVGTVATNYTTSYWRIGGYTAPVAFGYFPGSIDDVRIYNRELSAGEVNTLYQNGSKIFANNASTTSFTIDSGAVTAPSLLSIAGNYTNNGTFTHNSGTLYLSGTALQSATGTMTGNSAFNDLVFLNNSATTTIGAAASTTNLTAILPNTRIELAAGATTTISGALTLQGASGNEVFIHSTVPGTQWNIAALGSKAITYTNVRDSHACGNSIDASGGANIDRGNNPCWSFDGAPSLELLHYRWRFDNGGEGGATSASPAEDVALTTGVFVGDRRRLRIQLKNTGAAVATNYAYRLEYAPGACSTWTPVANFNAASTEHWTMDLSPYANNMASTSKYADISTPAGTFVPGYLMTADAQTPSHTLTAAPQYTELEYGIRSRSSVTPDITYCFRVTNAGSDTSFTYTQTPQIIVRPNAARAIGGGPAVEESGIPPGNVGGGGQGGGGGGEGSGTPPGNVGGGGGAGGGGGGDSG